MPKDSEHYNIETPAILITSESEPHRPNHAHNLVNRYEAQNVLHLELWTLNLLFCMHVVFLYLEANEITLLTLKKCDVYVCNGIFVVMLYFLFCDYIMLLNCPSLSFGIKSTIIISLQMGTPGLILTRLNFSFNFNYYISLDDYNDMDKEVLPEDG